MSNTAEALQQYAGFMVEKCRLELAGECKENAPRILDIISVETLSQIYKYHDCPAWSRYVIDLDGAVDPAVFSHANPLYHHTPRIFSASEVFGIEKLHRTRPYTDKHHVAVKQAVAAAKQQGIAIVYLKTNPSNGVYLIEERDQLKIKFAYFSLCSSGGCENG